MYLKNHSAPSTLNFSFASYFSFRRMPILQEKDFFYHNNNHSSCFQLAAMSDEVSEKLGVHSIHMVEFCQKLPSI